MNIEQEYYENDDFWAGALDNPTDRERISQLAAIIPQEVKSVLDVGCGDGMFVNYLLSSGRRFDRLHAVDRSQKALSRVKAEKSQASIDDLPFGPKSFHLVSSLEVIEHLPVRVLEKGLANLCHIAEKYVLISVPYLEDLDRSLIMCPACRTRFNPDYHMRSFDDDRMKGLLSQYGFEPQQLVHLGASVRYRGLHVLLNPVPPVEKRLNPFGTSFPCPVCAYYLPVSPGAKAADSKPNPATTAIRGRNPIWKLMKQALPKETRFRWVAALYERRSSPSR